jgi:hypothetical protein
MVRAGARGDPTPRALAELTAEARHLCPTLTAGSQGMAGALPSSRSSAGLELLLQLLLVLDDRLPGLHPSKRCDQLPDPVPYEIELDRYAAFEPSPTGSTVTVPIGLTGPTTPRNDVLRGGSCSVIS